MDQHALTSRLQREVDRLVTSTENTDVFFSAFLDVLKQLYQIYFSDSYCSMILRGAAFDTSVPLLVWNVDNSITIDLGRIQATFISNSFAVSCQSGVSNNVDETCEECISKSALYVEYSNGSHSGLYNLVEAGTKLSGQGEEKLYANFLQSGVKTQKDPSLSQFLKHHQSRILFPYPLKFIGDLQAGSQTETDVVALPISLAIVCHQYCKTDWLARNQQWFSSSIAQRAAASAVHIVPVLSEKTTCSNTLQNITTMQWRFDFSNLEAVLMADWSRAAKVAYHILLRVIPTVCDIESCVFSFEILVKYAIFWTMERSTISKSVTEENIVTWCLSVYDTLQSFARTKHFPHYFMPDVNVLCRFGSSSCCVSMCNHSKLNTNLHNKYLPAAVSKLFGIANYEGHQKHLTEVAITNHFADVFKEAAYLLDLQLYQRIHLSSSVDGRIKLHLKTLEYLQECLASSQKALIIGIVEWVTSSLGVEYHLKANMSEFAFDKSSNLMKAEVYFLKVQNSQSCSLWSTANLAHYLILCGRMSDSLSLLRKALQFNNSSDLSRRQDYPYLEVNELDKQMYSDWLMNLWLHENRTMDAMFSKHATPVFLKEFANSLSLLECQMLGAVACPVFVIRSKFLIFYLTAHCLKSLNQRDEMLNLLIGAESSTAETWVLNVSEDRNQIAYFNLLAGKM